MHRLQSINCTMYVYGCDDYVRFHEVLSPHTAAATRRKNLARLKATSTYIPRTDNQTHVPPRTVSETRASHLQQQNNEQGQRHSSHLFICSLRTLETPMCISDRQQTFLLGHRENDAEGPCTTASEVAEGKRPRIPTAPEIHKHAHTLD